MLEIQVSRTVKSLPVSTKTDKSYPLPLALRAGPHFRNRRR